MAEVYRPDVLSFRPVLKSELLHSPQVHHGFVPKLSPHSGKNIKKVLLTAGCLPVVPFFLICPYGWMSACGPLLRGEGVRGEARGGSDSPARSALNRSQPFSARLCRFHSVAEKEQRAALLNRAQHSR